MQDCKCGYSRHGGDVVTSFMEPGDGQCITVTYHSYSNLYCCSVCKTESGEGQAYQEQCRHVKFVSGQRTRRVYEGVSEDKFVDPDGWLYEDEEAVERVAALRSTH